MKAQTAERPGGLLRPVAAPTRKPGGTAAQRLRPGQVVQARLRGVVHWTGTVETVSFALGVVWIREDGLGERKLLDLREYQVRPREGTDK